MASSLVGVVLIAAAWFVVLALTSPSWFIAGELALDQPTAIHASKIIVAGAWFRGLYGVPMQLAWPVALVLAVRGSTTRSAETAGFRLPGAMLTPGAGRVLRKGAV